MSGSDRDLDETTSLGSLKSLDSLYTETVNIGGRLYQRLALERGLGFTPIDEDERERLDKQHLALQKAFDQRLIFPPIENPESILDCGYGSAAWACDVAEQHPQCEVIGVDISPHMRPEEIPQNLWLQVDDLNELFTFPKNKFDLVHSQLVAAGIKKERWRSYIRDCVRVTKPGGWLQFVEWYTNIQSDNGSIGGGHALRQLSDLYARALEETRDIQIPMKLGTMMREAGLVEVDSQMIQLPVNGWPTTEREREIGNMVHVLYKEGLGSQCNYLLHEYLHMDMPSVHVLVAKARQDLDNLALKPYLGLYVAIGRKPNS